VFQGEKGREGDSRSAKSREQGRDDNVKQFSTQLHPVHIFNAPYSSQMSPENAHKLIRIYMEGLILGVNTLYMLSCFLKQFALVGNGLMGHYGICMTI